MKVQDLLAYRKGFDLAMLIFDITKNFPKEETYSLTDQIRRSSRSVCANLSEGYRKRRYQKHFISKLTDSDSENGETQTWLEFAFACDYIKKEDYNDLIQKSFEVAKLLNFMILNPEKFGSKKKRIIITLHLKLYTLHFTLYTLHFTLNTKLNGNNLRHT